MVRADTYMSAHCTEWIHKSCSFLNGKSFYCICVIAAPELGAVIKHARVKAGATTGTVFEQKVREVCYKLFLHAVKGKHIAVKVLTGLVCRKFCASNIGKLPVHIPFYIFNICRMQDCLQLLHYVFTDFAPGNV